MQGIKLINKALRYIINARDAEQSTKELAKEFVDNKNRIATLITMYIMLCALVPELQDEVKRQISEAPKVKVNLDRT